MDLIVIKYTIYTDGALRRQSRLIGAWCCLVFNQQQAQLAAHIATANNVTNNRMELTAVINGLRLCQTNSQIKLYTDSQYVVYGINYGNKKTNQDLWRQYHQLQTEKQLSVIVKHVYGHEDNIGNNAVDLAMRDMLNLVIKGDYNY